MTEQQKAYTHAVSHVTSLGQLRRVTTDFGKGFEDARDAAYNMTQTSFKSFRASFKLKRRPVMFTRQFGPIYRPAGVFK